MKINALYIHGFMGTPNGGTYTALKNYFKDWNLISVPFEDLHTDVAKTQDKISVLCKENDINFIATKVGDRYVLEELNLGNFSLGGEQSGHIILKDYANTGDGELTSLVLFSILASGNIKFSELSSIMNKYPQVLINTSVSNDKKSDFYMNDIIKDNIERVENILGENGRVLVRPSGTEPLIRVMLEGKDKELIEKYAKELANVIEKELN